MKSVSSIPMLQNIAKNNESHRIYALAALSKIGEMSDDEKKEIAQALCKEARTNRVDYEVPIGLRYLGITDDPEIGETLLYLLQNGGDKIREEAGKALSALQLG
jgi:hypothetical protein